ncbi:MAG: hypothetical protein FJ398_17250 [Verrucomicrobia bacterium]|nr:hypothetical protein [Verrucomicrobiota bacterium]
MNTLELQKKLFAAARATPPRDDVPYAFEKRIIARIAKEAFVDVWALWGRLLWRAAAPCVALTLALTVWATVSSHSAKGSSDNLAVALENQVMAPLASLEESW